jgi:hypothetical protein
MQMQIQYSPLTQLVTLTSGENQIFLNESETREFFLKLVLIDFDSESINSQIFYSSSSNRNESMSRG